MANAIQATYAKILGAVLLLVGLIGFVWLPVFGTNTLHNLVHILSGILGLVAGFAMMGKNAKMFNVGFGFIYLIVAIVGFASVGFFVDLLALNTPDNILHVLIAIVSLGVGFGAKD